MDEQDTLVWTDDPLAFYRNRRAAEDIEAGQVVIFHSGKLQWHRHDISRSPDSLKPGEQLAIAWNNASKGQIVGIRANIEIA